MEDSDVLDHIMKQDRSQHQVGRIFPFLQRSPNPARFSLISLQRDLSALGHTFV